MTRRLAQSEDGRPHCRPFRVPDDEAVSVDEEDMSVERRQPITK